MRHGLVWEHFLDCLTCIVIGIAIGCAVIAIDEGHWNDGPYDIVLPGSAAP